LYSSITDVRAFAVVFTISVQEVWRVLRKLHGDQLHGLRGEPSL
jgi:hydrogenase-4 membrane subunit HyfE